MANTIITIEIATVIKAALVAVVPVIDGKAITAYSLGVKDVAGATEDKVNLPCVAISVTECNPMQYRSVLRSYPGRIEVATWYPEDKDQINLLTISQAVSQWMAEPSMTLTLAHWDSLVITEPPGLPIISDRAQVMSWGVEINTRKATA